MFPAASPNSVLASGSVLKPVPSIIKSDKYVDPSAKNIFTFSSTTCRCVGSLPK